MRMVRLFVAGVSAAALAAVLMPMASASASSDAGDRARIETTPQRGQCFLHGRAEMRAFSPPTAPVDCGRRHTAEVWRVARWSVPSYPWDLPKDRVWAIAKRACKLSTFPGGDFNYWTYFLPTKREWSEGERWIRCDAMVVDVDSGGKVTAVYWWRGQAL